MQLEINAFVSSLGNESEHGPEALDRVRDSIRSLADTLAALNLGIVLEVRDVQRLQTVARIVQADAPNR
ncbi:hypothetical protein [Roseomonas genomospecies 6]|uniref:Uncharacterized protein n=1 Tax=Roseomonas genomospecies 6 TaxID=214106 RepID=A0A9W7TYA4_9PROT|nr:hypothetical protein [Roseomonas genomospecies 6]KAA0679283.1 hypothetical protein DS843_17435 [Roseomonas genomospecies 6]